MPFKYCTHIKENGTRCHSAALRGRDYCYYHARLRARRLAMAQAKAQDKTWRFDVPALEDMHSVQAALMQVMDALAAGQVDPRRARLMLDGLRMASTNLRAIHAWIVPSRFEVSTDNEYRAQSYPGLESEFGLPKRIDLSVPPEVAFPAPPQPAPAAPEVVAQPAAKKPAVVQPAAKKLAVAGAQPVKTGKPAPVAKAAPPKPLDLVVASAVSKRPPIGVKAGASPAARAAALAP